MGKLADEDANAISTCDAYLAKVVLPLKLWVWFSAVFVALGWPSQAVSAEPVPHAAPPSSSPQPVCLLPPPGGASVTPGKFCGGRAPTQVGSSVNLIHECWALYGRSATPVATSDYADGWVCQAPGQTGKGIDMNDACRRQFGSSAIAALVGLRKNDWRCLTPSDVDGHVVPVLLYPADHWHDDAAFVTDTLKRIDTLTSGVRSFYEEKTSTLVHGTNAFILLSGTSADDWQNLALCTDRDACASIGNPYPWDDQNSRHLYLNRVAAELESGQWKTLIAHSHMKLVAFVTLGASPIQAPTWCGSADLVNGDILAAAPLSSYVSCSQTMINPVAYENAFFGIAHELGHAFGLPHSDKPNRLNDVHGASTPHVPLLEGGCPNQPPVYVFNDTDPNSNLLRPTNLDESIMCHGRGTSSELFPFELHKLMPFLLNWH